LGVLFVVFVCYRNFIRGRAQVCIVMSIIGDKTFSRAIFLFTKYSTFYYEIILRLYTRTFGVFFNFALKKHYVLYKVCVLCWVFVSSELEIVFVYKEDVTFLEVIHSFNILYYILI